MMDIGGERPDFDQESMIRIEESVDHSRRGVNLYRDEFVHYMNMGNLEKFIYHARIFEGFVLHGLNWIGGRLWTGSLHIFYEVPREYESKIERMIKQHPR